MIDVARWDSEAFPASGGSSAEGVKKQLGTPNLAPLEVLVREAIQNSWDARTAGEQLRFDISAWELDNGSAPQVADLLGRAVAEESLPLKDSLAKRPLRLLAFTDRGTTGLGGPTRADVQRIGTQPHDFVAFARNIGEPRDKEFGAGTYGFGKAAFYSASTANTILVYTRCTDDQRRESRFIGCALGHSFSMSVGDELRPFTGRHWWGIVEDELVEPLRNGDADTMADLIGLQPFAEDEQGTAIVVVDPVLDDLASDIEGMAHAIAWHAWPKLIRVGGKAPPIEVTVSWNGSDIPVPDPERTAPIDLFVAQYRLLTEGEVVESSRPRRKLGVLRLGRRLVPLEAPPVPAGFTRPVHSPVHHVALLRSPEFVVKYLEGQPLAEDFAEYAGVFRAADDPAVDEAFAAAEPPTHDDWVYRQLRGDQRTFVRVALERLRARMKQESGSAREATGHSLQVPLGHASSLFAPLIATATGTGASPSNGTSGGGGGAGGSGGGGDGGGGGGTGAGATAAGRVQGVGSAEFGTFRGKTALLFPCRVLSALPNARVEGKVGVAVDESARLESDGPAGAQMPSILGWVGPGGEEIPDRLLETEGRIGQIWRLAVSPVPDTMTLASFVVRGGGG